MIYGPLVLLFNEALLSLFVRYKIKQELDSALTDPIDFTIKIPPGTGTSSGISSSDPNADPMPNL